MVRGVGELAIGLDHQRHARRLDGELDEVEVDLLEVGELLHRRLDHRLGGDATVPFVERRVERSGVDADADRHSPIARFRRHGLDVLRPADVSRIEAQSLNPGLQRSQRHAVLMMDVGNHRHR